MNATHPPRFVHTAGPIAPRFAALHTRDYRRYFIATLLAMTADNIEHVISYWVLFQAFHSPALGGFAVIGHWVPCLLFSVHAGALADRYDCRKLIQLSQALFVLASIAWGVLLLTDTLQMWHTVVILLIHGAAGTVGAPAAQIIIHDMVGGDSLSSAIRLNASSRHLSILLGPAIGGGLMLLTLVQTLAPPRLRGTIVGLFNTAILGLRAGSGVTVGVLGAVIDVHWSLTLSAAAVVVTCAVLLAREARSVDLTDRPP